MGFMPQQNTRKKHVKTLSSGRLEVEDVVVVVVVLEYNSPNMLEISMKPYATRTLVHTRSSVASFLFIYYSVYAEIINLLKGLSKFPSILTCLLPQLLYFFAEMNPEIHYLNFIPFSA